MYAFCFTIPYGFILMLGGVIGFLKGSTVSLVMGAGFGALIVAMGFRSVSSHKKGLTTTLETGLTCLLTCVISVMMYRRYAKTGAIMPALLTCVLSTVMSLFLIYRLLVPLPSKSVDGSPAAELKDK